MKSGDKEYVRVHDWIKRQLGKASLCKNCEVRKSYSTNIHWANISGNYKYDIDDWMQLCPRCHRNFDVNGVLVKPNQCAEGHYMWSKNIYTRIDKRRRGEPHKYVECKKCRILSRRAYNLKMGIK